MGTYAGVNNRCATKGCGHFVADHTNLDPKTGEVDRDSMIRWGCHATGSACTCADFQDSGTEELSTSDGVSAELKQLRAEKAAADKAELEKLRADKAARDAAAPVN